MSTTALYPIGDSALRAEIDRLLDPSSHLGESVATVERILAMQ